MNLTTIFTMYITTMSITIGMIFNMFIVKTKWFRKYNLPIDCHKNFYDGKRIFGDNKTYLGLCSMIVLCSISNILWGLFCNIININQFNLLYNIHNNMIFYNMITGALFGLIYGLCELPNSFIKRRFDIIPGKTKTKGVGYLFFIIDQIDSAFGVIALVCLLSNINNICFYFFYIFLWGITHILINLILYKIKVRRNL